VLNLPTTASRILVETGAGATSLEVHASFDDLSILARTISQGAKNTLITAPGSTVTVTPPSAGMDRNVKFLSMLNSGAACQVTVQQTLDGITFIEVYSVNLLSNYTLQYNTDSDGFRLYDDTGRILEGNA
jgi:hypothetical protein